MSQELIKRQIEAPDTVEKFAKIFGALHKTSQENAKQMFEVERFHFLRAISESTTIPADVSPVSALGCFLEVVGSGLSFSSASKHVYIMSRSVKTGKKTEQGKDVYENRLYYQKQVDGIIFEAQRAGSIQYCTQPVIVYEGDDFYTGTNDQGQQIVVHKPKMPRDANAKAIGGYVYVVFPSGLREPSWMEKADIDRLKGYSASQNGRWNNDTKRREPGNPNALYGSYNGGIDPGFLKTKLVKQALRYVKKSGVSNDHEVDDEVQTELPTIDQSATYQPTMIAEPVQPVQAATISSPAPSLNGATKEPF